MMATVLTLVASVIFLIAFVMYNKDMLAGKTSPSIVSWALFSFITVINSSSYLVMSGDWVKTVVAFTDCFICLVTLTILLLRKGRGSKLDLPDKLILVVGALSLGAWWMFHSAMYANLILQGCYILGFLPTYRNVMKDSRNEPAAPWLIWAFAFVLSIVVVILRWEGHPADLANPIMCFVQHAAIGLLALRKPNSLIAERAS
ncbi:MAG TPA: hypothetical protein VMA75_02840 [Candidatus Paceibacterota bacterium]|nr:hypothetical protein [Candidatus Paceibacterota bacterium]